MTEAAHSAPTDPQKAKDKDHKAHLKNADGSWKFTNKLVNETSPYLLQHAHNPVDWRPWGPEAFAEAKKRGVPIFLSIGYSTCYWCHVMERQVFENEKLAVEMNKLFVCVKVDREERPDVDDIYMTATQMMTGHGGWPMSVFLTPPGAGGENDRGLKPFFAGTYFPPEPQRGMPGFGQVMQHITTVWKDRKPDVVKAADRAAEAITQHMEQRELGGELTSGLVVRATTQLLRSYDPRDAGYGKAPKFPTPNNLTLIAAVVQLDPEQKDGELWKSLAHTLERMARGGMYDQVGGGFHRYSTDGQWLVPHFEKMLYDQGQLVEAYLIAQSIQPDKQDKHLYARVVRETCDYVLREMADSTGAFWSAQDAEVNAREGGNYVWLPDQVKAAIKDEKLAKLALEMYGLDKGTNFQDPHHPDEPRTNVVYLPVRLDELAKKHDMSTAEMAKKRKQINDLLYPVRMKRDQPGTDDKVLVSWNGMMIAGMARAGKQLNEPRYTEAASKAARYILDHMRDDEGGLMRSMRRGKVSDINGFLEDYTFFVHGLIELHRATGDSTWLEDAKKLTATARNRFADQRGGYYDTLADQADLFVRTRSTFDGAVPTGNSQMMLNLVDLHALTKDEAYLKQAVTDLRSFAALLAQRGAAMAHMQQALLRALEAGGDKLVKADPVTPTLNDDTPVKITATPAKVDLAKGPATVKVTLDIGAGYHINGPKASDEGLVATAVRLEQAKGYDVKVKFPDPLKKKYAFSDKTLAVYEGKVVVEVTITKTADADAKAKPVLVVEYQACTDKVCQRPVEVEAPVRFE